jgi:hypothetical protein
LLNPPKDGCVTVKVIVIAEAAAFDAPPVKLIVTNAGPLPVYEGSTANLPVPDVSALRVPLFVLYALACGLTLMPVSPPKETVSPFWVPSE